ncbi:hypothetical protein Tco_1400848 [Tanacetum coccineum]
MDEGGPITPLNIQATDFRLKNHMIQQVQNSCQFHGLPGDVANKHLDKFLTITQSLKQNGVTNDALRLYLFPYSLTHHATAWFDRVSHLVLSLLLPSSYQLSEQMAKMRKDILQMYHSNQQVNSVTPRCETCGGTHSYYECQAVGGYTQDVYATTGNCNSGGNTYQPQENRNLLSYRSNNFLGPPSFNPPNNQNQEYNQNHGQNFNQNQAPNQSSMEDLLRHLLIHNQNHKKDQEAVNQFVQNQIGQLTKALQERPQGALPSNTVPNLRGQINSITTRSGLTTVEPYSTSCSSHS